MSSRRIDVWPPLEIKESVRNLRSLSDLLNNWSSQESLLDTRLFDEVEHGLVRLLIVRSCGHLEFSVDRTLQAYAETKAPPEIVAHVKSHLYRGANPKPQKVVDKLASFSAAWGGEITESFDADDELIKREISLLVDRRNKMALRS